jgi:hypothetical protein
METIESKTPRTDLEIAKDNGIAVARMWQMEAEVSDGRRIRIEELEKELATAQEIIRDLVERYDGLPSNDDDDKEAISKAKTATL